MRTMRHKFLVENYVVYTLREEYIIYCIFVTIIVNSTVPYTKAFYLINGPFVSASYHTKFKKEIIYDTHKVFKIENRKHKMISFLSSY
jgi:hypothetical protein